ncbi:MAG: ATP-dependent DNA helicase RecQ [Rikenellaceae bacterium]
MKNIDKILKRYWGYDSFRPLQREIIESVTSKRDTLALMPTGGGKSLTYQVSALAMDGICIVITPLISLMKDQIDALRKRNIIAKSVHGGMTAREIDITLDNCVYGDYKFLYVSPERLETDIFKSRVARMNVSIVAVDEAHCISQWGYDFRPSYLKIASIRKLIPDAVMLAVTATATQMVVTDIEDKLELLNPRHFRMSFARPNISYVVRNCSDKLTMTTKIINSVKGSGIVYCNSRKRCEEVAQYLNNEGISADFYHGALSYPLRSAKQESWIREQVRVVVATNAFGMGIDKHNVRYVVHYDSPSTLEAYYQEAGRAGRDGEGSYAVLLVDSREKGVGTRRIEMQYPTIPQIKQTYSLLCNYLGVALGEGEGMSFDFNVFDFASKFRMFSTNVLNALNILQLCGYLNVTDNIDNPTRIQFVVSREDLYRVQLIHKDLESFVYILMRIYTGIFTQFVPIDENYIAHISGYSLEYIKESLKKLSRLRVINYIPARQTPLVVFNNERLSEDNIRIDSNQYTVRKNIALKRLDSMIEYSESTTKCRSLILQNYFGEQTETPCGCCDVCRAHNKARDRVDDKEYITSIKNVILKALQNQSLTFKTIKAKLPASEPLVRIAVKELLDSSLIKINDNGEIMINEGS